jgi:hypothetical protein
MTMNDLNSDVSSQERVDDLSESICVDLGDAVAETKQWSWDPWVIDNLAHLGWEA